MPVPKERRISRRDFIKLSGLALGALELASLTACNPGFEPPGELPSTVYDPEPVVFNGKTVSLNELSELDITAFSYALSARDKLNEIKRGTLSLVSPGGYLGSPFPEGWELDSNKSVIIINETKTKDYVSQVLIGRKKVGEVALSDSEGFNSIVNDVVGASAYHEHSLLVVGRRGDTLWFDNVESENENGETRIVVDSQQGKVYQINTNKPNLFENWFNREEIVMDIGEIDVLAGESNFQKTLTPFSEGFINFLRYFIDRLPESLSKEEKLNKIKLFFSGSRLNGFDVDDLKKLLGESSELNLSIIEVIKRFKTDLPFDNEELAFINATLSERIKEFINNNNSTDSFGQIIKGIIPDQEKKNSNVVRDIIEERTSLPLSAPELYFIQVRDQSGQLKWFSVGRYNVWENDVDRTVFTTKPNGFSIGEKWFTYGEVNPAIVDNKLIRQHQRLINNFPFDEIKEQDQNANKPLTGELFGGLLDFVEARRVSPEAIIYGWDPSEGNLKHRINPGLKIIDDNGDERFLKINLDSFWNNNIKDLPFFSNRWLPILGNSPRIIKDVTKKVVELIQQGNESTSPFGLDQMADYSLFANLTGNTYTNYDFLSNNISPLVFANLTEPGEVLYGGKDNAILVFANNEKGEQVKIYRYGSDGEKIGEINVDHPVIISPKKIEEFRDGEPYIIIAEDEGNKETFVIREEDAFPLGARSSEKLGLIMTGEAAAFFASVYGGYRLVGNIPLAKDFLKGAVNSLAKVIVTSQ